MQVKSLEGKEEQKAIQRRIMEVARREPSKWIEEVFRCHLWDKQKEIVESVAQHSRTTVRSCEGSGKSYVVGRLVLWFLYNFVPSTVITTAPTFRQVSEILWREIAGAYGRAAMPLSGDLTATRLNLADDWFAIGISTDDPERFRGLHNKHVLVVVDEASGVSEEVYLAIENPLSTGHTKLILIGNPTNPAGPFKGTFTSNIYHPMHISAFDTPNFSSFGLTLDDFKRGEWQEKCGIKGIDIMDGSWVKKMPYPMLVSPPRVAERLEEWGESSFAFQTFVMGNFPEAGENNLIPLAMIEAAVEREVLEEGDLVAGLDIARYGDGETVLVRKIGDKVKGIDGWSHQDIQFTTGRVAHLCRLHGTPNVIRIDATAIGQDDATILGKEGYNIDEVFVGQPAVDTERFGNRRAELYWLLKKRFEDGKISIPNDRKLIGQLADIRFTYSPKGKLMMESKEEMRARGSKSPDRADALMLSFIPIGKRGKPKWRQY